MQNKYQIEDKFDVNCIIQFIIRLINKIKKNIEKIFTKW